MIAGQALTSFTIKRRVLLLTFATVGPSTWNRIPDPVHNPNVSKVAVRWKLKTVHMALAHQVH